MRFWLIFGLAWLAALGSAHADDQLIIAIATTTGRLELKKIDDTTHVILVDGKEVYRDTESLAVLLKAYADLSDGQAFLFERTSGGTACPATYLIMQATQKGLIKSKEFGNCSDIPTVTVTSDALRVTFPAIGSAEATSFVLDSGRFVEQSATSAASGNTAAKSTVQAAPGLAREISFEQFATDALLVMQNPTRAEDVRQKYSGTLKFLALMNAIKELGYYWVVQLTVIPVKANFDQGIFCLVGKDDAGSVNQLRSVAPYAVLTLNATIEEVQGGAVIFQPCRVIGSRG